MTKRNEKSMSRKNRWKGAKAIKLAVFAFAFIAVSAGVYFLYHSTLFPIRKIEFYGNKYLGTEEMRALTGVSEGDGLWGLSAMSVYKKLSRSPWIKALSLRKEPPGRFMVMVEEVEPFALLRDADGVSLIDETGRALDKLGSRSAEFLPVIEADPKNAEVFYEAMSLAKTVKGKGIEMGGVEIISGGGRPEDLSVRLDGMLVKIGQGEHEEKLERLFELEGEIRKRRINVDYVDLRFANRVVVKPVAEVVR
jgi:cell division protein FtsQ